MQDLVESAAFCGAFAAAFAIAPLMSRWAGQPIITMHLLLGLLTQVLTGLRMPVVFAPAHNAALACITLAAGSELIVSELRRNARAITYISCMITLATLICVSTAYLLVSEVLAGRGGGGAADAKLRRVQALLAAVVAVGRSPSSAIAIVSESQAEGPFTMTVLSVTMVSDVLVILLFTAATEFAHELYSSLGERNVVASFFSTLAIQIGLSVAHGVSLAYMCLPILGLDGRGRGSMSIAPSAAHVPGGGHGSASEGEGAAGRGATGRDGRGGRGRGGPGGSAAGDGGGGGGGRPPPSGSRCDDDDDDGAWLSASVQPALLLVLGGYAFGAEALLKRVLSALSARLGTSGVPWQDVECVRLEPMLACMVAGFWLCNLLGRREELHELLHSCLPPLLAFFFYTTGTSMRVHALRRSWPTALALFASRSFAIWVGNYAGVALAARQERRASSSRGHRGSGPPDEPGWERDETILAGARSGGSDDGPCSGARCYGWAAYMTQAGITLGLSDEIATNFPTWGPALQAPLISSVVLTQIVGPPLLKLALTTAGEAYAIPPYLSHSRAGSRGRDDSTAAILPAADGVRDGRDAALSSGAALVTPIKSSRGGGADSKATGDASDSETHESFELRGTSTRGAAT